MAYNYDDTGISYSSNTCDAVQRGVGFFADQASEFASIARDMLDDPIVDQASGTGKGSISINPAPSIPGYSWSLTATKPTRRVPISYTEPTAPTIGTLPTVEAFSYASANYSREIVDRVLAAVDEVLAGAALIPDDVWNAMRSRGAGNLQRTYQAEAREARAEHAAKGHDLPGVVMLARLREAKQKRRAALNELTLQVSTQQATQRREDYLAAIQQGLAGEKLLADIHTADQERLLKSMVEKIDKQIASQTAVLGKFQTEAQVFGVLWGAIKTKIEGLNAEFAADAQVYQTEVQAESSRVEALAKMYASDLQYLTAKAGVDTEQAKLQFGYWNAELSARTQWQGHVTSVYAQLGSSFASAANVSMSMGTSSSYGHSVSYGQSVSRSYGVGVSVSVDDPGGLNLTETLSAAPTYLSWSSC